MRKAKQFSILFLGILVVIIYYKINNKQQDESIQQYKLEFESDCECKKNNKIILTYLSDSHYQIDFINKESKQILKSYFLKNDQNLTCNKFSWLRRGINQKIVSFSLYGKDSFYSSKLINLTRLVKKYYPNWLIRIYHDDTILESIKCEIECHKDENNKLMDNSDSLIIQREIDSVQVWLNSNKIGHIMRGKNTFFLKKK